MITQEEEGILAKLIRNGDKQALDKLVNANLRFVVSTAKKYQYAHPNLLLSDLINEGNIGLIEAAKRFDETKGFKFISYAVWWIRQAIMTYLNNNAIVHVPVNKSALATKVRKTQEKFEQKFEREATIEEVVDLMEEGTCAETVSDVLVSTLHAYSLNKPLGEDDEGTLMDTLSSKESSVMDNIEQSHKERTVKCLLNKLDKRENEVLTHFFGIGTEAKTLDDIAEMLDLSRERIRQLKESSLKKLKTYGGQIVF